MAGLALDEKNMKALVSLLSDDDKEVLNHVEEQIISLGSSIIPFLEHEWESNLDPRVQRRIEDLLHTVQFEQVRRKLLTWVKDGGTDLLEGMWIIGTYQYPDLELDKIKQRIEDIYYETWLEMKGEMHPFDQVKILNNILFQKLKFSANTKNFHSPSNSMINVVLESKKGNPISLCAIYMMVAQKLKLPIYGVNLPNLFILTYKTDETQFYINAFNKGLIFSKSDIDNYIHHLNLSYSPVFYEPCNNIEIMKRVLRNLVVSYEKLGDHHKVREVKEILYSFSDEGNGEL
jgi:regulator of sirC expression with transglutaminase-like and TPR domain